MKKRFLLIGFIIFSVIFKGVAINAATNTKSDFVTNTEVGTTTFLQQFEDPNVAKAVADSIGKGNVNTVITQEHVNKLKALNISATHYGKDIKSIKGIGLFNNITSFSIEDIDLAEIPEEVKYLTKLNHIAIKGTKLKELPTEYLNKDSLDYVILDNNELNSIPEDIGDFTKLTKYSASNNNIKTIPSSFYNLDKLGDVDFSENEITSLSSDIEKMTKVSAILLNDNLISDFPGSLTKLPLLYRVELNKNKISSLPDDIDSNNIITTLDLGHNEFNDNLSSNISKFKKVQMLNLDGNKFTSIPLILNELSELNYLEFSDNLLEKINQDYLADAPDSLREIKLNNNKLQEKIPDNNNITFTVAEQNVEFETDVIYKDTEDEKLDMKIAEFMPPIIDQLLGEHSYSPKTTFTVTTPDGSTHTFNDRDADLVVEKLSESYGTYKLKIYKAKQWGRYIGSGFLDDSTYVSTITIKPKGSPVQETTLSGTVYEKDTTNIIVGAKITLPNNTSTVSDENGKYSFSDINAGETNIKVTSTGYLDCLEKVNIVINEDNTKDFYLEKEDTSKPPVDPEKPTNPEKPIKPTKPEEPIEKKPIKGKLPSTGNKAFVIVPLLLIVSITGFGVYRKYYIS